MCNVRLQCLPIIGIPYERDDEDPNPKSIPKVHGVEHPLCFHSLGIVNSLEIGLVNGFRSASACRATLHLRRHYRSLTRTGSNPAGVDIQFLYIYFYFGLLLYFLPKKSERFRHATDVTPPISIRTDLANRHVKLGSSERVG